MGRGTLPQLTRGSRKPHELTNGVQGRSLSGNAFWYILKATELVLLRILQSCKWSDSGGFVKTFLNLVSGRYWAADAPWQVELAYPPVTPSAHTPLLPVSDWLWAGQGRGVPESVAMGYDLSAVTLSVSHTSRAWENHCGALNHTLGYAFAYSMSMLGSASEWSWSMQSAVDDVTIIDPFANLSRQALTSARHS